MFAGSDWVTRWDRSWKPGRSSNGFPSALSAPLREQASICVLLTGEVQAFHSSPVGPTGPPCGPRGPFPLCQNPGGGHSMCSSSRSLPRAGHHPGMPSFPPESPPRGRGSDLITPLPSLPDSVCIFHKVFIVWESFSQSPVFSENSSTCTYIFLMHLCG